MWREFYSGAVRTSGHDVRPHGLDYSAWAPAEALSGSEAGRGQVDGSAGSPSGLGGEPWCGSRRARRWWPCGTAGIARNGER
jgi:hypothetical protein